jgi:hypothetical protein
MPSAIRQININESKANAARVGPRLRLSRTPAKPIAACRIARSQSHPLRLPCHTGGRAVIGETPEWMLWVLVGLLTVIMCLPGLKTLLRPEENRNNGRWR